MDEGLSGMACWYEGPLAAFDTETTGVDVETDRIVSAAVVVQDAPGTRPRVTRWLVNPGVPVPEAATAVHGLTEDHLQRNGRWPAPVMQEIAEELAVQATAGRPLVVMNAPFDLTLLDRELRRHRASSLSRWFETRSLTVLDPRVLAREHRDVLVLVYFQGASVAEAAQTLGIPPGTVKSRAYYALRALRRVLPGYAPDLR